jgi:hypothetical protein
MGGGVWLARKTTVPTEFLGNDLEAGGKRESVELGPS